MKKVWPWVVFLALVVAGTVFIGKSNGQDESIEGSVGSLDQSSSPPVLDLKTADDKVVKVTLDSETTLSSFQIGGMFD